jgi:hypothetical protein
LQLSDDSPEAGKAELKPRKSCFRTDGVLFVADLTGRSYLCHRSSGPDVVLRRLPSKKGLSEKSPRVVGNDRDQIQINEVP